ncbi:MAG: TIGR00153 family protein [Candidatus Hadarchaeales archaeon]
MRAIAVSFSPITGRREKQALEMLVRNSEKVMEVVRKTGEMMRAFFNERNLKKAEDAGKEISRLETEADAGRRGFMEVLHGGAFLPAIRGDLARLAESLDTVADVAEATMRELLQRKRLMESISAAEGKNGRVRELWGRISKMVDSTEKTLKVLCEAVKALGTDLMSAGEKAKEVDRLEHEVDLIEQELLRETYALEDSFDPISIIQLDKIIRKYENITDRAEDVSDIISILVYTLRA